MRIYVVSHKPCSIPSDDMLTPIHVGRAVSPYKDEMSWMQGDNTGDNNFSKFMGAENMTILSMVMKKRCPEYFVTLEKICDGIKFHPFNMLLCRKGLFDDYCQWMFAILEECEKYIKPAPYTNARRALAYMAELLTGVYLEDKRNMALYESLLQHDLSAKLLSDRNEKFNNPAILLGLTNDGIVIE